MPQQTKWEAAKHSSKASFDWAWKKIDLLGTPVNRLSNKLGSEAFWPTDIARESDKAARILRSFCKDGFYDEEEKRGAEGVTIKGKQRVVKKIPQKVIQNAKGLCIFTTMRTGLWVSGAGGSGVLVARLPDGSWSPPSGVLLHTAGLGFLVGVDIYDCVVVINSDKALKAFENPRLTLGGEFSAVAGPAGVGGLLETEIHKRQAPVFNYIKSRGFYAGVQIDGTVIIERGDENERFYGQRLSCKEILAGKVKHPPHETKMLLETIRAAQGSSDIDESLLPADGELAPGDFELASPTKKEFFGVPAPTDPDPFGVHALEETGLEIHEAGTGVKPPGEEFEFKPAPTSPVYAVGGAGISSTDGADSHRSSMAEVTKRSSQRSTSSSDHGTQTLDMHVDGDMGAPDGKEAVATGEISALEEVERERRGHKAEEGLAEVEPVPVGGIKTEHDEIEGKEEAVGAESAAFPGESGEVVAPGPVENVAAPGEAGMIEGGATGNDAKEAQDMPFRGPAPSLPPR